METAVQNNPKRRFFPIILSTMLAAILVGIIFRSVNRHRNPLPPPTVISAVPEPVKLAPTNDNPRQAAPVTPPAAIHEKPLSAPAQSPVKKDNTPHVWTAAEKTAALKAAGAMRGITLLGKGASATTQWIGDHSAIREASNMVLRTAEDWAALEKNHLASGSAMAFLTGAWPTAPDFSRVMMIAIFDGEKPSEGYQLHIHDIRQRKDGIHVYYGMTVTPQDELSNQTLTQPYLLKAIPRSDLPVFFHRLPF